MGVYSMTFGLAFSVAPWAGVAVLNRFGSEVLWSAALLAGLLGALVLAFARKPHTSP